MDDVALTEGVCQTIDTRERHIETFIRNLPGIVAHIIIILLLSCHQYTLIDHKSQAIILTHTDMTENQLENTINSRRN